MRFSLRSLFYAVSIIAIAIVAINDISHAVWMAGYKRGFNAATRNAVIPVFTHESSSLIPIFDEDGNLERWVDK